MGGIPADVDGQVLADAEGTPVAGFYAAGECACISVHGANRLGTNSLLGASLFGKRSGAAMAAYVQGAELGAVSGDPADEYRQRIQALMEVPGSENVEDLAQELKTTMTNDCGIYRDQAGMQRALEHIASLQERFKNAPVRDKGKRFNTDLLASIEAAHLLTFSEVIVGGALARTESRGAHYRSDYTKRDDEAWLKHTLAHKGAPGEGPRLSYKPVDIDFDRYPPQERKY
jgi:succinate dehydrogenase / fumarate reductase flavoprotein subunit